MNEEFMLCPAPSGKSLAAFALTSAKIPAAREHFSDRDHETANKALPLQSPTTSPPTGCATLLRRCMQLMRTEMQAAMMPASEGATSTPKPPWLPHEFSERGASPSVLYAAQSSLVPPTHKCRGGASRPVPRDQGAATRESCNAGHSWRARSSWPKETLYVPRLPTRSRSLSATSRLRGPR